jgi:Cu/Ag efflux pump CusA
MLAAIVRMSLAQPRIVTALSVLIGVLGVAALFNARFDVFPDFAPPHVLVQTEAPGLDATQVEALVTRPLEGLLAGAENVTSVRSIAPAIPTASVRSSPNASPTRPASCLSASGRRCCRH